ncbi:MAG TPA: class I SAM-dependent methyltransferase [Longimicrobiales bacterium]|nr:class I SAM-dependent methyltransferase [Longimicrobiales bacterium]
MNAGSGSSHTPAAGVLRGERYMEACAELLEHCRGSLIYDSVMRDNEEKLGRVDAGYARWLDGLLTYLKDAYGVADLPILDFGSGMGSLTVLMNSLGHRAIGTELQSEHLRIARILAEENGMNGDETFVLSRENRLPFDDDTFGIITMFSVLEHIDNATLEALMPELRRVCRGVVFALFPNRWKIHDDHSKLRFVTWLPRSLAVPYIRMHGHRHQYHISDDGTWDVVSRGMYAAAKPFERGGFRLAFPPDEHVFPPLDQLPAMRGIGRTMTIGGRELFVGLPYPVSIAARFGIPRQAFYPYLNLVFVKDE